MHVKSNIAPYCGRYCIEPLTTLVDSLGILPDSEPRHAPQLMPAFLSTFYVAHTGDGSALPRKAPSQPHVDRRGAPQARVSPHLSWTERHVSGHPACIRPRSARSRNWLWGCLAAKKYTVNHRGPKERSRGRQTNLHRELAAERPPSSSTRSRSCPCTRQRNACRRVVLTRMRSSAGPL